VPTELKVRSENSRVPKRNIHLGRGQEREMLLQNSGGWWRQTGECRERVEGSDERERERERERDQTLSERDGD